MNGGGSPLGSGEQLALGFEDHKLVGLRVPLHDEAAVSTAEVSTSRIREYCCAMRDSLLSPI